MLSAAEVLTPKGWGAVKRLSIDGTVNMTRATVERALKPGGRGMIASVTVLSHHGSPAMAHSRAACAAVEEITREWAQAYAADGISAVALALGCLDTESPRKDPEELTRGPARPVLLGGLGEPREFGWLAALVASPLGRSMSGTTITLDGGAGDWWGPSPPVVLADETGEVPTQERPRG